MRFAVAGFASALVQLGLAVFGLGGFAALTAHPAVLAMFCVTIVLIVISLFSAGNLNAGEREDRSNRWAIGVFVVLGLLLAYLSPLSDRHGVLTIDGETTRWLGLAIYTIGGCLRLWPVFVLGRRFSGLVAIQHGHTLVTNGIYRYVRNPSYLGMLIGSLGWALVFRSGVGIIITVLLLVPLVPRMNAEERLLSGHFGAEYERYRARTWRLLPGIY